MEIKYEKADYVTKRALSQLGFETINKFHLYGKDELLEQVKELVGQNFKTYNYQEGLKFGEHEVHLWYTNAHMQLSLNSQLLGEEGDKKIYDFFLNALQNELKDLDITVIFKSDYEFSKEKVEDFLNTYQFDINNLPVDKFRYIQPQVVGFPKLSAESNKKIEELNNLFYKYTLNKKAVVNGMEGKFKHLVSGRTVFFKKRAKTTYFPFELQHINSFQLV